MKKFSQRVLLALGFIGAVGSFHGIESAAGGVDPINAWAIGVEDYPMFEDLGVYTIMGFDPRSPQFNPNQIKKRYLQLSFALHPDRNRGRFDEAGEAFKLLKDAYDTTLSHKFNNYDEKNKFNREAAQRAAIVAARELRERNFKNEEFAADGTLSPEALENLWQLYQADLKDIGTVAAQAARLARRTIDPAAAQAAADAAAAEAAARAAEQAAAEEAAAQAAAEAAARAQAQAAADAAAAQAAAEEAARAEAQAAAKAAAAKDAATAKAAADAAAAAQAAAAKAQVMVLVAQHAAEETVAAKEVAAEAKEQSAKSGRSLGEILRMQKAQRQGTSAQAPRAQAAPAGSVSSQQKLAEILRMQKAQRAARSR